MLPIRHSHRRGAPVVAAPRHHRAGPRGRRRAGAGGGRTDLHVSLAAGLGRPRKVPEDDPARRHRLQSWPVGRPRLRHASGLPHALRASVQWPRVSQSGESRRDRLRPVRELDGEPGRQDLHLPTATGAMARRTARHRGRHQVLARPDRRARRDPRADRRAPDVLRARERPGDRPTDRPGADQLRQPPVPRESRLGVHEDVPQARRPGPLGGRRAEAGQADRLRPVEAQGVQAQHLDRVRAQHELLQEGPTVLRRDDLHDRPGLQPPPGGDAGGPGPHYRGADHRLVRQRRSHADAAGDQGPREGHLHSRGGPDLSGLPHEQAALSGRARPAGGVSGRRPLRADKDRAVRGVLRLLRLCRNVPAEQGRQDRRVPGGSRAGEGVAATEGPGPRRGQGAPGGGWLRERVQGHAEHREPAHHHQARRGGGRAAEEEPRRRLHGGARRSRHGGRPHHSRDASRLVRLVRRHHSRSRPTT